MKKLMTILVALFAMNTFAAPAKTVIETASEFLMKHEGTVTINGVHVLYDDKAPAYINGKFNTRKIIGDNETFEQFKARCKGVPTIGYGTTDEWVCRLIRINDASAKYFLRRDVEKINSYMPKKFGNAWNNLKQNQQAALLSYFYNCGMYSKHPAMLKLMKSNPSKCYTQMDAGLKTAKAKGLKGLIDRRQAEQNLFNK